MAGCGGGGGAEAASAGGGWGGGGAQSAAAPGAGGATGGGCGGGGSSAHGGAQGSPPNQTLGRLPNLTEHTAGAPSGGNAAAGGAGAGGGSATGAGGGLPGAGSNPAGLSEEAIGTSAAPQLQRQASSLSHFASDLGGLLSGTSAPGISPAGTGYSVDPVHLAGAGQGFDNATKTASSAASTLASAPTDFPSLGERFTTALRRAHSSGSDAIRALTDQSALTSANLHHTSSTYTGASEANATLLGSSPGAEAPHTGCGAGGAGRDGNVASADQSHPAPGSRRDTPPTTDNRGEKAGFSEPGQVSTSRSGDTEGISGAWAAA